jgi:hypothetical protein
VSGSFRRGDVVTIPGPFFGGKQAKVVRVSKRTGGLTLEFIEECGIYSVGSQIYLMPYEVRPKPKEEAP